MLVAPVYTPIHNPLSADGLTSAAVAEEPHTIGEHEPAAVWLHGVPVDDAALVVHEAGVPANTFTVVDAAPAAGEVRVHYDGAWASKLEFAAGETVAEVEVSYNRRESALHAGYIEELQAGKVDRSSTWTDAADAALGARVAGDTHHRVEVRAGGLAFGDGAGAFQTLGYQGGITDGDILVWDAAAGAWVAGALPEGVDLEADYAWEGVHTHTQALTLGSYLQGTTANGYLDLRGDSGATSGIRLNDAGNLGLGETPSTWYSTLRAIEGTRGALVFQGDSAGYTYLTHNAYHDTAGWKYKAAAGASSLWLGEGSLSLRIAGSASAGTPLTWNVVLSLDASAAVFGGAIASAGTMALQAYRGTGFSRTVHLGDLALNAAVDNQLALGYTGLRWTAVHAVNGAIQTSTAESKDLLERIDPTLALRDALVVPLWRYHYVDDQGFGPSGERHRHAGPVIEDVPKLYRTTDDGINPLNVATWALAAVRGLNQRVETDHERLQRAVAELLELNPHLVGGEAVAALLN